MQHILYVKTNCGEKWETVNCKTVKVLILGIWTKTKIKLVRPHDGEINIIWHSELKLFCYLKTNDQSAHFNQVHDNWFTSQRLAAGPARATGTCSYFRLGLCTRSVCNVLTAEGTLSTFDLTTVAWRDSFEKFPTAAPIRCIDLVYQMAFTENNMVCYLVSSAEKWARLD